MRLLRSRSCCPYPGGPACNRHRLTTNYRLAANQPEFSAAVSAGQFACYCRYATSFRARADSGFCPSAARADSGFWPSAARFGFIECAVARLSATTDGRACCLSGTSVHADACPDCAARADACLFRNHRDGAGFCGSARIGERDAVFSRATCFSARSFHC